MNDHKIKHTTFVRSLLFDRTFPLFVEFNEDLLLLLLLLLLLFPFLKLLPWFVEVLSEMNVSSVERGCSSPLGDCP